MTPQEVHDSYVGLQKLEHDFRAMKTGLLEVRPVFVRKKSRTWGHVLHAGTETESRVGAAATAAFGTTDSNPTRSRCRMRWRC